MTVSTTPRFGVTRWSDPSDPFTRSQMDGSHAQIELLGAIDLQDLLASRPAPGTVGRFFSESSASAGLPGVTWRDDGAAWRSVGSRIVAASASDVAEIVRGVTSQSGDLQQWQNAAGSVLASIESNGRINALAGIDIATYTETLVTLSGSGTQTLNLALANEFALTLTGATTIAFSNVPSSGRVSIGLRLKQDATGGRTATWPGSVDWGIAGAPALSTAANAEDYVTLITDNGGTKWYGFTAGQGF